MFPTALRFALLGAGLSLLPAIGLAAPARDASAATPAPSSSATTAMSALSAAAWSADSLDALDVNVFEKALTAAACAVRTGDIPHLSTLTVIDYSRPSTEPRLWVFDLENRALLYRELVAHGEGSGGNIPSSFSNDDASHQSSIGLFSTADTYVGKNGYSLRLHGLDAGFNDHALARAIVMHGAPYVNDEVGKTHGRLGRSWGCPALRAGIAHEVIDRIKGSGLIFAYYPDQRWLESSKYLGYCPATPPSYWPAEALPIENQYPIEYAARYLPY